MMRVCRCVISEQRLQHALNMRRREQVVPARDQRHALTSVIKNHCEMIGR